MSIVAFDSTITHGTGARPLRDVPSTGHRLVGPALTPLAKDNTDMVAGLVHFLSLLSHVVSTLADVVSHVEVLTLTITVFSEEPYHPPGSFLYSKPLEVDQWCQSVPFGEEFPLTPPYTASECATSDSLDMCSQAWSQTSLPEDWVAAPAQDHSTYVQPSGSDWQGQAPYPSVQDMQPLNTQAWINMTQGSVDMGLSPVLSHESQSSHTLNSLSEPDVSLLPASLLSELSYPVETSWMSTGSNVYPSSHSVPQSLPGNSFISYPAQVPASVQMQSSQSQWHVPQGSVYGPYQPAFHSQGGQVVRNVPHQPLVPRRPLLPRTEGSPVAGQPAYVTSHRTIRPQTQGLHGVQRSASTVSISSGQPLDVTKGPAVRAQGPAVRTVPPAGMYRIPSVSSGVGQANAQSMATSFVHQRPGVQASMPYVPEQTAEDFSEFLRYDPEEPPPSSEYSRLANGSVFHSIVILIA